MKARFQVILYGIIGGSALLSLTSGLSWWVVALFFVFTTFAVFTCSIWKLRVNNDGFDYRSPLGIPRKQIPFDGISPVSAVTIHALEWGGWGWRLSGAGTGLITAGGPGFRVTRSNERIVDATCSDTDGALAAFRHYGVDVR